MEGHISRLQGPGLSDFQSRSNAIYTEGFFCEIMSVETRIESLKAGLMRLHIVPVYLIDDHPET